MDPAGRVLELLGLQGEEDHGHSLEADAKQRAVKASLSHGNQRNDRGRSRASDRPSKTMTVSIAHGDVEFRNVWFRSEIFVHIAGFSFCLKCDRSEDCWV